MKEETILKKAIEKAEKNGYEGWSTTYFGEHEILDDMHYALIFSHDFAKAFFGEGGFHGSICGNRTPLNGICCDDYDCREEYLDNWKHHLQELVLCKNPLQYLRKFL